MKYITPSIELSSFNCPHCGVLAQQFWWRTRAVNMDAGERPSPWTLVELELRIATYNDEHPDALLSEDSEHRLRRSAVGEIVFSEKGDSCFDWGIDNLHLSKCYACEKTSVWIYDSLVHPPARDAVAANGDMPDDVRRDFDEAAQIVSKSPRGAAALLRLAIQKLLKQMGGGGDNINADIGALVKAGLDPRIQQSLDVVRVIGNNAVHPGTMDLRDDRSTADSLFTLVNLIVDTLISQPKHIAEAYAALPKGARDAIAARDKK